MYNSVQQGFKVYFYRGSGLNRFLFGQAWVRRGRLLPYDCTSGPGVVGAFAPRIHRDPTAYGAFGTMKTSEAYNDKNKNQTIVILILTRMEKKKMITNRKPQEASDNLSR